MSEKPSLDSLRRCYRVLLRRQEAEELCRTLGIGSAIFKRWCQTSPVPGQSFRFQLTGYKEYRYRREIIIEAAFGANYQQQA